MAGSNVVSSVFYGYPAGVIAEWCGVSIKTATRWKRGQRQPSATAMKLFMLCRERRVLGAEWHGWMIKGACLVDPEGNETTQGQLRAYFFVYQLCNELVRTDQAAAARLRSLMSSIA